MTPLVVKNEPPVTFLRRKMTGGRFSMGVVIRRYTGWNPAARDQAQQRQNLRDKDTDG